MAASPTERSWCVLATPVTGPDSVWFLPVGFRHGQCLRPTTTKDTTRIAESTSTPQLGTSHKTCLRGFGGNWSIAWTFAMSHVGRTSNAFKVTMKLHTFLFQMVVTPCIYVQYLWKYGFAKSSDNLYASCTLRGALEILKTYITSYWMWRRVIWLVIVIFKLRM